MSRQAILRLTDTFFRRWWLYVVPVIVLAGVGFMSVKDAKDVYRSAGSINVQSTSLLSTLDGTNSDPGFGYETPAAATAGTINSLIGTYSFVEQIATNARIDPNPFTIAEIRSSVAAYPDGRTIVKVAASHEDPAMSQRLALATITTFTDSVIAGEVEETQVAVDVLTERIGSYQEDVDTASAALAAYVEAHPAELGEELRPAHETAEITRLNGAITRAEQRLFDTQSDLETAELKRQQTESSVNQRLRMVDAPRTPFSPESNVKETLLSVAMFILIGLLLGFGGVALATVLDHTIRFPGDVNDRLGQRVLAVVPKEGSRRWRSLRGLVTTSAARPGSGRTLAPMAPASASAGFGSSDLTFADSAATSNGDAKPGEVHPAHRQRRRPGGTRPSVTFRKDK